MLEVFTWIITALSILGLILNIKKKLSCFIIWGITNIFWIIIDIKAELYAQAFLFFVYLLLSIWGIYSWKKEKKDEYKREA